MATARFLGLPTFLSAGSFLHGNIQLDLQASLWLVVLFSYLLWLLSYLEESLCLHETFSNTVLMCQSTGNEYFVVLCKTGTTVLTVHLSSIQ